MLTKEEVIAKSKIILVDNICGLTEKYKNAFYADWVPEINDFLSHRIFLRVGSNDRKDFYTGINIHHYKTSYWYSILPDICNYLNIPYNAEDFNLVSNIVNEEDFSYLLPKDNIRYKVTCTPVKFSEEKKLFINYVNQKEYECNYSDLVNHDIFNLGQFNENSPYHKLFIFAHQPVTLENLGNPVKDRTLIISANSHSIPLIPIFSCYYKKVIVIDNRFGTINFTDTYENEEKDKTDSLLLMSYDNNLNKFLDGNL